MIYQRRALQRRLDELRTILSDDDVGKLVERLNRPGKDRVAAMYEVVVLHSLSKCGAIQSEIALPSRRRPDIMFQRDELRLTADVTTVSDEGLDRDNPYFELSELIENAKKKLNLPVGGLDLRVRAKHDHTRRGVRTALLLPPRQQLQTFVQQKIIPRLREQIDAGWPVLKIAIEDNEVSIHITIDRRKSPFSSGGYAAYDVPRIKDRNPLFNALKSKAVQLRGAEGLVGVIVGDGDCVALSDRAPRWDEVSPKQIIEEFFRQYSSVDFVLLLSVREIRLSFGPTPPPSRHNDASLFISRRCEAGSELDVLFRSMIEHFPRPAMMPVNGALRARESGYGLGYHGGYIVSGRTIRIGLREFTEIFAGIRSLQDNGGANVGSVHELNPKSNLAQAVVLRNLMEGRLPTSIEIERTDENEPDDWVKITFGEPDPAITPFR